MVYTLRLQRASEALGARVQDSEAQEEGDTKKGAREVQDPTWKIRGVSKSA